MKCAFCNRPLKSPTVTLKGGKGPLFWGPKCAKRAGLTEASARQQAINHKPARQSKDARQMDIFEEAR